MVNIRFVSEVKGDDLRTLILYPSAFRLPTAPGTCKERAASPLFSGPKHLGLTNLDARFTLSIGYPEFQISNFENVDLRSKTRSIHPKLKSEI